MRTPRHFSRPFWNGLAWTLVGCAWMACLNPQPDELPTYDESNPAGGVDMPTGSTNGAAGSGAGLIGDDTNDTSGAGTAGSSGAGVEAPTPDAGAPPDAGGADAGPPLDAGTELTGDAGPEHGDAQ